MPATLLVACSTQTGPRAVPPPTCAPPVQLRDVSSPTAVVGDGTPGSCTAAALGAAASRGGTVVFACGAAPVAIAVASPIVVTADTVLDGGGLVTLDGGGSSRILVLDSSYDRATPRLVVQRLAFRDGASPRTGDDTADGGGAIYRDGGSLTVIDCAFDGNRAPRAGSGHRRRRRLRLRRRRDRDRPLHLHRQLREQRRRGGQPERRPRRGGQHLHRERGCGHGRQPRGRGVACPALDQRGQPRGERCTLGAVEVP